MIYLIWQQRMQRQVYMGVGLWFVCLLIGGVWVAPAHTQALHPRVSLTQPAQGVNNALDLIRNTARPTVGLVYAKQTAERLPDAAAVVNEAVSQWELLLLGMGLSYQMLEDEDLKRNIGDDFRVLIFPVAEALSEVQAETLKRFVERGGGLIISGRVGLFNEKGRRAREGTFFRDVLGATYDAYLPENPAVLVQQLAGGHALTAGLPGGYRLTLAPSPNIAAVRPLTSTSLGRPYAYGQGEDSDLAGIDPLSATSMALYGQFGIGHVVWMGFQPQDVSIDAEQQAVYQGFVVNALSYAAAVPTIAVRTWPEGKISATVLAALPLVGTDFRYGPSMNRVLHALESAQVPATFFLTSQQAHLFPPLLQRMSKHGEIALGGHTDALLKGETVGTQSTSLIAARNALGAARSRMVQGVYPPAGAFDEATLLAMEDARLRYLLAPPPFTRSVPRFVSWGDAIDQRRSLALALAEAAPSLEAASRTTLARSMYQRPSGGEMLIMPLTGRDDYAIFSDLGLEASPAMQVEAYTQDFTSVHDVGGLYVLPFHPEIQALTEERASVLRQVALLARHKQSWLTTLGAVSDWWQRRAQVNLSLTSATPSAVSFVLQYDGAEPIAGLSLDLYMGQLPGAATVSGIDTEVQVVANGDTLTLTFARLLPGSNRITISFSQ